MPFTPNGIRILIGGCSALGDSQPNELEVDQRSTTVSDESETDQRSTMSQRLISSRQCLGGGSAVGNELGSATRLLALASQPRSRQSDWHWPANLAVGKATGIGWLTDWRSTMAGWAEIQSTEGLNVCFPANAVF
ncbi:MAG: hypothetical protein K0U66_08985 [Gammaproteobacteria bacterium]|nr:hypothetical protein [Gammaproteobacteria bacterium]